MAEKEFDNLMKRFFLTAVLAAMAAGGALAQDTGSHAGHDMSVTTSATTASPAAEAYTDAMDRMHGPMMEGVANADPDGIADDAWMEAKSLVGTIEDHELIDPTVSSETLPLASTMAASGMIRPGVMSRCDAMASRVCLENRLGAAYRNPASVRAMMAAILPVE